MKAAHRSSLIASILAVAFSAHATAAERDTPPDKFQAGLIELPRQTVLFKPTREDMTVGCAVFVVASSNPLRLNDVEQKSTDSWRRVYLKQLGKNEFELPELKIEYSTAGPDGIFCMSLKVWFEGVSNMHDSFYYENLPDRYALVSWCSKPPESVSETMWKARFSQNRVSTLKEFRETLAKPIVIKLNQRPRQNGEDYPMIYNNRRLGDAELKQIEKCVRDRGEQYIVAISVSDLEHARVSVSLQDFTRFHGTRAYEVVRKDGTWQIDKVEEGRE